MDTLFYLKSLRSLINQTPLIIDPSRDGARFQDALTNLPAAKLQAFYKGLNAEERRRFHYVANICLGYESWSKLYKDLVVLETQTRLADRMEAAYADKAEELRQREEQLEEERHFFQEQIMALESENHVLRQENLSLQGELEKVQEGTHLLQEQQQQMVKLLERYRQLIADLRRLLPESHPLRAGSQ